MTGSEQLDVIETLGCFATMAILAICVAWVLVRRG